VLGDLLVAKELKKASDRSQLDP